MSWDSLFTLAVLAGMVAVLAREAVAPSVAVLGAVVALLVAGVLTPAQAFSGFSNPAPITVAALFVVSRAVDKTRALQPLVGLALGAGGSPRWTLARILVPTAAVSAFLNNTPIVAMLAPQVATWAQRRGQPPSRYLMPLSFAAIFGGMVTLVGTSTNLVVSGLLVEAGEAPLRMFELSPVGLPIAVLGLLAMLVLAPVLLPDRRAARDDLKTDTREFVVRMAVQRGGGLAGRTVEEAGLRHLEGVFLVEIRRPGETIAPVTPRMVLHGGDTLTFVGRAGVVPDLQAMPGLVSSEQKHVAAFDAARQAFFEAVPGPASPLVGRTLQEVGFRGQYQGAVVAIHRAGRRVRDQLGRVRLQMGDTLLVLAGPDFDARWRDRGAFLLVSRIGAAFPAATRQTPLVLAVAAAVVLAAATGVLPILSAALLGAFALVAAGVVTPAEARQAVNLDVIVVIAGAFGLAAALQASGLAAAGAQVLLATLGARGPAGALLGVVAATAALVGIVTNNAAAVLMFPIAASTAASLGLEPRPFAIAVAFAASASFLTPMAYQTNVMVYGPGGYRFGDYARLGLPLTALVVAGAVWLVPIFWPLG